MWPVRGWRIGPVEIHGEFAVKLRETRVAGSQLALPAWSAAIVHVPDAGTETVLPVTVQTAGVSELNVTARPLVAVALTVNGATGRFTSARAANVIVCAAFAMLKLCVTGVAAA